MNPESEGVIEQEILTEESLPQKLEQPQGQKPPKHAFKVDFKSVFQKLISLLMSFKRPKVATLIIFFGLIVLIYFSLALLAKKNTAELPQAPSVEKPSSTPKRPTDLQVQNFTQQVQTFSQNINQLDNYQEKLQLPSVELDISFQK